MASRIESYIVRGGRPGQGGDGSPAWHDRRADLMVAYYDPTGPFAADTSDALQPRDDNRLTVTDLLAGTFLDVIVRPRAARRILGSDAPQLERQLSQLGPDVPLWDADDETLTAACEQFDRLDAYDEVGPVIASKLLARKPPLIPIVDSVVTDGTVPPGRARLDHHTAGRAPGR